MNETALPAAASTAPPPEKAARVDKSAVLRKLANLARERAATGGADADMYLNWATRIERELLEQHRRSAVPAQPEATILETR
jgi:hypothetical protein